MGDLPGSVLFACSHNAIRSPMAEALLKFLHGQRIYVQSVGVRPGETDPFAIAALDEIGLDLSRHAPKSFDDLKDDYFDLVISLSPEAQHRAVELTRTSSCEIEFWPTFDASLIEGNREARLEAYRSLRDDLLERLRRRFPPVGGPITL
jgi:protein-tyrosine-phosphatase